MVDHKMRGRTDPLEVRLAKGNTSNRPIPDAVERVPGEPEVPSTLGPVGLKCWFDVTAVLRARGQLSKDSGLSLMALCSCWEEWNELRDNIQAYGRTSKFLSDAVQRILARMPDADPEDWMQTKVRPEVALFQDADRRLRAWLIEFGLTDVSRGKVEKAPTGDGNERPNRDPNRKPKTGGLEDYGLTN